LKKLIVLLVIVLAGIALYRGLEPKSNNTPQTRFITAPVQQGTLSAEVTCTGTLAPLVEVLVGSQVSGRIKEMYVDYESRVKKGQLIALIDPDLFKAKAEQARADVAAAEAELEKAKATLVEEKRNLKRNQVLVKKGSISQSQFDTIETKADTAAADVLLKKARIEQMKGKFREAELELKYTRILTPVSGVVIARAVDVGQTVAASFQAPVLFRIAEDLKRMQVNTNVDEADIGRVQVGQKAEFTVPAFPEQEFSAHVRQIRNEPRIAQNVVTYNVVLDVDNTELKLRPGMTANVRIMLTRVKDAMTVPDRALRFTPPPKVFPIADVSKLPKLKTGEARVWKLKGTNNGIEPLTVRRGIVGTERVQIISDKLKPGDLVVVDAVTKKKKTQRRGLRFRF
jgi:HlyD family secretion protein